MAKLRRTPHEVRKAISERIQAGKDLVAKAEVAERTLGHRDWLHLLKTWRDDTVTVLGALYEEADPAEEFGRMTEWTEHSTPRLTFPSAKANLEYGLMTLRLLVERLELAVSEAPDSTAIDSLHPEILSRCRKLFASGDYEEAVEKSFKVVRDRLRALTTYETGSDAFGKGNLYIEGAAAPNVDEDFQNGVKFLTMAIDRFRNEKAHTADGNIREPIRAYEYLRLSSLAVHLLDSAKKASP